MWAGVLMRASALNSVAFLFTEVPRETLCLKSSRWRTLYSNRGSLSSLGLSLVLALIHKVRGRGILRSSGHEGIEEPGLIRLGSRNGQCIHCRYLFAFTLG